MIRPIVLSAAFCALAWYGPATAEPADKDGAIASEQATFRVETITDKLDYPWSLAFLPDGSMLVTEKDGRLRRVRGGALDPELVAGLDGLKVYRDNDSGLLEVVLHPRFAQNAVVYLTFAEGMQDANHLAVARGRWTGDAVEDLRVIFRARPDKSGAGHPGGCMIFLTDETFLLTVGDGYSFRDQAQDRASHLGKILRLTDDGGPAPDTPQFAGPGFLPEIFTAGHRNPQGLTLRPGSDEIWEHEHGPMGGDEINILVAGANYGWPLATYGIDYDGSIISNKRRLPGTMQPIFYWVPSIAPSGMAFYDGDVFPEWQGDLFVGALGHKMLQRFETDSTRIISEERLLEDRDQRIRDVRSGPDGFLYLLTDEADGKLLRLVPAE